MIQLKLNNHNKSPFPDGLARGDFVDLLSWDFDYFPRRSRYTFP